jgi:hypothetical protein
MIKPINIKISRVKLKILNKNRRVRNILINGKHNAGIYSANWNLKSTFDVDLQSGLYRAFLEIDEIESYGDIQIEKRGRSRIYIPASKFNQIILISYLYIQ